MINEEMDLPDNLRRLASVQPREANPQVEAKLIAAFRTRHPRRVWRPWVYTAAAAAALLLAFLFFRKHEPEARFEYVYSAPGFTPLPYAQSGVPGASATIPGAPYSAQAVTQRVQTLSDGNRITQTTTNAVARDSKGRVYREESLPGAETPHMIAIYDPVASQHFTLDPNTKTAYKTAATENKKIDEAAFTIALPMRPMNGPNGEFQIVTDKAKLDEATAATTTDLGSQIIEGVHAKGTRITRTIPAGSIGNDLPIVITTETWYSPELTITVMSKSVDPRMGESTYKLTNLTRAEPSASLFQIPADYTVKEHSSNVVYAKKTDK